MPFAILEAALSVAQATDTELLARATELQTSWGTNVAIAFVLLAALTIGLALLAWYLRLRIQLEKERITTALHADADEREQERDQRARLFDTVLQHWQRLAGDGNGTKGLLAQWQAEIRSDLGHLTERYTQIEANLGDIRTTLEQHIQEAAAKATAQDAANLAPSWLRQAEGDSPRATTQP